MKYCLSDDISQDYPMQIEKCESGYCNGFIFEDNGELLKEYELACQEFKDKLNDIEKKAELKKV